MTTLPAAPKRPASLLRKAWRVFYICLAIWGAWGIIQMLRAAPTPQVTVSSEAKRRAEEKLAVLIVPPVPSSESGQSPPIALTQEEVDSYLAAYFPLAGGAGSTVQATGAANGAVRGVTVTFEGDRARIFVLFHLLLKNVTLQLEGRLHVVGGYLRYEITGGQLGYLSLPGWALDQGLAPLITKLEVQNGLRVPADIRDIRVENGELIILRQ